MQGHPGLLQSASEKVAMAGSLCLSLTTPVCLALPDPAHGHSHLSLAARGAPYTQRRSTQPSSPADLKGDRLQKNQGAGLRRVWHRVQGEATRDRAQMLLGTRVSSYPALCSGGVSPESSAAVSMCH